MSTQANTAPAAPATPTAPAAAKSFKQMIKDGEIKRHDMMKVQIDDIHEEPGFNLREEGEDLNASIEALCEHIMGGGMVPAMEVRPRPAGGVWLVDGHRRRRAFLLARERGAPVEWIGVVPFTGNDADRVARVITSAEGRSLTPLEVAKGYKRLLAFGLTVAEVAKMVSKTTAHVNHLMVLANANTDVQKMVAAGDVSAATAVELVRHHGEQAGAVLAEAKAEAVAAGKTKVTAATLKGKRTSRADVEALIAAARAVVATDGADPDKLDILAQVLARVAPDGQAQQE